jgi:cholesterol oxidase
VAITSSFHPDDVTHVEPVRYGRGSNLLGLMQTVLTDGDGPLPRWRVWVRDLWKLRRQVRGCTTASTGPNARSSCW